MPPPIPQATIAWRLQQVEREAEDLRSTKADKEVVKGISDKVDGLTRALWAFALGVPIGGIGLFLTALVIIQATGK